METKSVDSNIVHFIAQNLNNDITQAKSKSSSSQNDKNESSKISSKSKQELKSICCVCNYLIFKSFKFYSVRVYLILLCLITLFTSMIQGGYISAIIVSIQTEFNISISRIGLILSAFDIMSLFSLPIVSYIGSKYNKPRIISILTIVYAVGAIVFTFPFFFDKKYTINSYNLNQANKSYVCKLPSNITNSTSDTCVSFSEDKEWAYSLFIIGQLLMSWGVAPQFSLGITYITDNVEEKYHALFTGVIYGAVALGPAIGYLLASFFLSKWLYLSDQAPVNITQTDSNWVGAWYLGFIVSAGCVFLFSLILITFPNKIRHTSLANETKESKNKKDTESIASGSDMSTTSSIVIELKPPDQRLATIREVSEVSHETRSNMRPIDSVSAQVDLDNNESIKAKSFSWCFLLNMLMFKLRLLGFFSSFPRLLRNFRFTLLTIIISVEAILVAVFVHYMIIYAQSVYLLSESTSSILVGSIIVPAAIVGALLGGFIVNRFKLQIIGSTRLIISSSTVVLAGILITLLIKCESTPSVGIDIAEKTFLNQTQMCLNRTCSKCEFEYKPVCDSNTGESYASACYAGCLIQTSDGYANCSCPISGIVKTNKCSNGCDSKLIIFLIVLFILVAAESICLTPITILLLKLINKDLHPFGLGVMRMSNVLIANIPTPLLLSYGFEQTCILWKTDACTGERNKDGKCLEYNVNSFHYVLFGTLLGVKSVAWLLMIWFSIHIHRSYIFRSKYTNSITLNHDLTAPKFSNQTSRHKRQISTVPVSIDTLIANSNSRRKKRLNKDSDSPIVLIRHNKTSSY